VPALLAAVSACGSSRVQDSSPAPRRETPRGELLSASAATTTQAKGAAPECSDGVDNDGDGLVDWAFDMGCSAQSDSSEGGKPTNSREGGWTVFEPSLGTRIVHVSAQGNDGADGLTPDSAKRTVQAGVDALRDRSSDWLLLRRGDTFGGSSGQAHVRLSKSGRSPTEPIVIGSYGPRLHRPILQNFELEHAGAGNLAVVHLRFPNTLLVLGGSAENITVEGCMFEGEGIVSNASKTGGRRKNVAIRRNVAVRTNTPFFFGSVDGLLIEENVIYRPAENGKGNHGMYLTRVGNSNVTTRGNLVYCGLAEQGVHGRSLLVGPGVLAHRG
jgi:hypothetical protein